MDGLKLDLEIGDFFVRWWKVVGQARVGHPDGDERLGFFFFGGSGGRDDEDILECQIKINNKMVKF